MQDNAPDAGYRIFAADKAVYGPVELPTLISWIKEERVIADTWIYNDATERWQQASQMADLQMFFRPKATAASNVASSTGIKPGELRRIKLLSELSEEQLARFAEYLERIEVRQWTDVLRQGEQGEEMYFILEGELRVRLMIAGKESVLMTLLPGEFFGDMALFDDSPRSADVVSNKDSVLLKLTGPLLEKLRAQAPDTATIFLFALCKSLAARIRADNKRFRDSVNFARSSGAAAAE
jgi:hypothetical protein